MWNYAGKIRGVSYAHGMPGFDVVLIAEEARSQTQYLTCGVSL